jgi:subtilisin-like proprotein convertase family protein
VVGTMPGGAEFIIIKIFNNDGLWSSGNSNLGNAAIECRNRGANVLSMSLGGGSSATENNIFQDLYDNYGILNIAAAGNDGNTVSSYPASYNSVISVGAIDRDELAADFTQYPTTSLDPNNPPANAHWDVVEFAGGGVNVLSTWPGPPTAPHGEVPRYQVTVAGVTYDGGHIDESGLGDVTGPLVSGGLCTTGSGDGSWAGAVVICQRGSVSFAEKVNTVLAAGGVGAIIYNNADGDFLGTCGGDCTQPSIPAISLTQSLGQTLVDDHLGESTNLVADNGEGCDGCSGSYFAISGTSMATPGVAAAVGMIWDACGGPAALTPQQIRLLLRETARDLTGVHPGTGFVYGAGWDRVTGWGLPQLLDAQERGNELYGAVCPIGMQVEPAELEVCGLDNTANATFTLSDEFLGTANMTIAGVPVGASASFSPNPVIHPTKDTVLTLSGLGGVASGIYEMEATATDASDPGNTTPGYLTMRLSAIFPSQPNLSSPVNGATGLPLRPILSWSAASDANEYLLEVASDSAFSNVVYTANVTGTSHALTTDLSSTTTYYWRITASNYCGDGQSSASFSFTTTDVVCEIVASADVPKAIADASGNPNNPTPGVTNSVIISSVAGALSGIEVLGLQGTHTFISDLSFDLISPAGDNVRIMDRSCGNTQNFNLNLSDDAAGSAGGWPCPPVGGGTYKPSNPLATFEGQEGSGTWTLRITDYERQDTGTLQGWSLNLCVEGSAPTTYTVTTSAIGQGSIGPATQEVNEGGTATGTYSADPNWSLSSLVGDTCNPVSDGAGNWSAANITAACAIEATFVIDSHQVTTSATGSGVINPASQMVNHDGTATGTYSADPNWSLSSLVGDTCNPVSDGAGNWSAADIAAACVVEATFAINSYTVTFEDWDASVLATDIVDHGSAATAPADPTREGYTFAGWDVPFDNVTSDLTVTAQYQINSYTVTFLDWDGSMLATDTVDHGSAATAPADPTREGYTFTGWDVPFDNVTGDLTVTAQYQINSYTVTFLDWDGTVLATDIVDHGSAATAPVDPTREGYTFTGWDVPFDNVTGDLTVTAQYQINSYTVTFLDWDGSVLATDVVDHGSAATAPADPTREGYTFAGWDVPFDNVTGDLTVTAQYQINSYTVTFLDWDGSMLATDTVDHGGAATAPVDPIREGYTFTGWDVPFDNVTGDLTVTAQYQINSYTVTFLDWDGTVLATDTVDHGGAATAPADPTREGYTFTGWDVPFDNVTGDLTVTAQYQINSYTVTFLDWDGTVLATDVSSTTAVQPRRRPTRPVRATPLPAGTCRSTT